MAKKTKIDQLIKLVQCGWRPYEGEATGEVYDRLKCQRRGVARWFAKDDIVTCIGCERLCSLSNPKGFQLPLIVCPIEGMTLTATELLAKKKLLSIHEVAYIVNLSLAQARKLYRTGQLRVARDNPIRIPVEDVKAYLAKVDWWEGHPDESKGTAHEA